MRTGIFIAIFLLVVIGICSTTKIVFAKGETSSGSGYNYWQEFHGHSIIGASGFFTAGGSCVKGQVQYFSGTNGGSDIENGGQLPIPNDGRILSLAVNTYYNTLDANAEITVRLNGKDTALKITVPSSSTSVQTTTANINMSVDDLVSLEVDATAAETGGMKFNATYAFKLK